MNFIDTLKTCKQSEIVAFHDVLLNISVTEKVVHIFFEGKTDESFYRSYLSQYFSKFNTYVAGNKRSVYELCEKLYRRKNSFNYFIFFVDKDIDYLIPVEFPIYDCLNITEYYSIENYLVCEKIYSSVLSELYKIGTGNQLYRRLLDKFKTDFDHFLPNFLPIMAWILFHKRHGNKPNLNNINSNSFITVDSDLNINIKTIDEMINDFDKKTSVVTNMSLWNNEKEEILSELKSIELKKVIRGKYEIHLFVKYCNAVRNVIEKVQEQKVSCSFELNTDNAIDILSPRLEIPEKIKEFIQKNQK
ncbi:MAG: DUF4435 domain-containing protein [Bacteroidales bacterium]|jgi:hypothetical protein|nr:DUF4435 domain-containing protein [Bacteroidales bacterium]